MSILTVITLLLIPRNNAGDIPGLSEMAAINLKNINDDSEPTCNANNPNECLSITDIHDKMSKNASLIRNYVHSTNAVGIIIKNSRAYNVYYHWLDDNDNPLYQGKIKPFGTTATLSYITHRFFFTKKQNHLYNKKIHEIYVNGSKNLFLIPPSKKDKKYSIELNYYNKLLKQLKWREEYERKTGYPWLSHYDIDNGPRKPTSLPMYNAEYIGQEFTLYSNESYWICVPNSVNEIESCRDNKPVEMKMIVESIHPPIFRILNTINDIESSFIINTSKPRLYRSTVGGIGSGVTSTVRTSFNGRLNKNEHEIINTIYKRANDIFGFKENYNKFESLQVIHYDIGQEYTPHHDFGESTEKNERVFTLLFYLNDQINKNAGGETYFPKADGKGIAIHPGKGNSVLFYSGMKDGNSNDLALHAALPVKEGEKWACNFWIWD